MNESVEAFLAQSGVRGMKWGHRKAQSSNEPKHASEDKQEHRSNVGLGLLAGTASIAAVTLYLKANPAQAIAARDFIGSKGRIVLDKATDVNQSIRKGRMYASFVLSRRP